MQVSSQFSVDLPATVAFDYPTISSLAGFIVGKVAAEAPTRAALASSLLSCPDPAESRTTDIVGISGALTASPVDEEGEIDSQAHNYATQTPVNCSTLSKMVYSLDMHKPLELCSVVCTELV